MQWLLQRLEDTDKLAAALDRLGIAYSWHKIIPIVGRFTPEPVIADKNDIVIFGSYSVWRTAKRDGLWPGVFKLKPFVRQRKWHPFLLNGKDALFLTVAEIPQRLASDGKLWFVRPVDDSKEMAGAVQSGAEIVASAERVLALAKREIPRGSLRHDTKIMLTEPVKIFKEWRLWVVDGKVVTWSLYKEGSRVVYRHEVDDDALAFGKMLVEVNPGYSRAYVLDVCRTADGLRMLETNNINSAGFYAADLMRLAAAIDAMEAEGAL